MDPILTPAPADLQYQETSVLTISGRCDDSQRTDQACRARGGRAAGRRAQAAADAAARRHLDGDGPATGPGQRDHAAGQARCGVRRDGEPRRERSHRPAPDQAGPHHVHISRRRDGGYGRSEGGVSASGEPRARPGVLDSRQPRAIQRVRPRTAIVGGRLPLQGWGGLLSDVHRRDGRSGRRSSLPRSGSARLHVAGAAGDVAGRPGCVRPLLEPATREGPYRRRRAQLSVSHRRQPDTRSASSRVRAPAARKTRSVAHRRVSAATLSGRDALLVGCCHTAALRPADRRAPYGEQRDAAVCPALPVQPAAARSGPTDQSRPPIGVTAEYPLPGRGLVLRHNVVLNAVVAGSDDVSALLAGVGSVGVGNEADNWDITTTVGATAVLVATARALEAQKRDPLAVDSFAEVFCRAVGDNAADVLDGKNPDHHLKSPDGGKHLVSFQVARTRYFDDSYQGAADAGVRQVVILAAGLDSRAYRLSWPDGMTIFELDRPEVLNFKRE